MSSTAEVAGALLAVAKRRAQMLEAHRSFMRQLEAAARVAHEEAERCAEDHACLLREQITAFSARHARVAMDLNVYRGRVQAMQVEDMAWQESARSAAKAHKDAVQALHAAELSVRAALKREIKLEDVVRWQKA